MNPEVIPSQCVPWEGRLRCDSPYWAVVDVTTLTDPVVPKAKAMCPEPTQRDPPRQPSVHVPIETTEKDKVNILLRAFYTSIVVNI